MHILQQTPLLTVSLSCLVVEQEQYSLFVDMDIDGSQGLTVRYFENLTDSASLQSSIELSFSSYSVETPLSTIGILAGLLVIPIVFVLIRRKKKN